MSFYEFTQDYTARDYYAPSMRFKSSPEMNFKEKQKINIDDDINEKLGKAGYVVYGQSEPFFFIPLSVIKSSQNGLSHQQKFDNLLKFTTLIVTGFATISIIYHIFSKK